MQRQEETFEPNQPETIETSLMNKINELLEQIWAKSTREDELEREDSPKKTEIGEILQVNAFSEVSPSSQNDTPYDPVESLLALLMHEGVIVDIDLIEEINERVQWLISIVSEALNYEVVDNVNGMTIYYDDLMINEIKHYVEYFLKNMHVADRNILNDLTHLKSFFRQLITKIEEEKNHGLENASQLAAEANICCSKLYSSLAKITPLFDHQVGQSAVTPPEKGETDKAHTEAYKNLSTPVNPTLLRERLTALANYQKRIQKRTEIQKIEAWLQAYSQVGTSQNFYSAPPGTRTPQLPHVQARRPAINPFKK